VRSRRRSSRRLVEDTANIPISALRPSLNCPGRDCLIRLRDGVEFRITWSKLRFGHRVWFECPSCKRRAGRLYTDGVSWLCRVCHNLDYKSQRNQPHQRWIARAQAIRRRLGQEYGWAGAPIPLPPRRMRTKTYDRLVRELQDLEARAWAVINERMAPRLARLEATLDRLCRESHADRTPGAGPSY
jgi:ribosomal protein L37AE/L43A